VVIDPSAVISLTVSSDGVTILIQEQSGAVTTIETLWSPEIDELVKAIRHAAQDAMRPSLAWALAHPIHAPDSVEADAAARDSAVIDAEADALNRAGQPPA